MLLKFNTYTLDTLNYFRFVGKYEFMRPVLIVHDLDLVKRITVKDFEHFIDHRSFVSEDVEPLFARNLVSLKGIYLFFNL